MPLGPIGKHQRMTCLFEAVNNAPRCEPIHLLASYPDRAPPLHHPTTSPLPFTTHTQAFFFFFYQDKQVRSVSPSALGHPCWLRSGGGISAMGCPVVFWFKGSRLNVSISGQLYPTVKRRAALPHACAAPRTTHTQVLTDEQSTVGIG